MLMLLKLCGDPFLLFCIQPNAAAADLSLCEI
jgi:hypothetical protein